MKRRQFLVLTGAAGGALALNPLLRALRPPLPTPAGVLPGVETHTMTTCLMCPGGCGLRVRAVDGFPVAISGNPNHALNQGGVCTEGISGLQMLYHPDRLLHPLRRRGAKGSGDFEPVSWNEALDTVTRSLARLKESHASEKATFVLGRTGSSMEELARLFFSSYGSPSLLMDEPSDAYSDVLECMHRLSARPAFDFENSDLVLSFGADLLHSWEAPVLFQRQYARLHSAERGSKGRLVVADIRLSGTAAAADEWVGIAPASFGALALGIAYVMLRERLYDASFVREHVHGFEDTDAAEGYSTLVQRDYSPEVVSQLTGTPVERILALGKAFGEARRGIAVFDANVTCQPGGLYAGMAIHSLNLLKGNLNRPGGVYLQPEVPLAPLSSRRARPARTATENVSSLAYGRSPREVMFFYYSNPVASSVQGRDIARVLKDVPLVVSFSPFLDETSRYADLILPDALPLERWEDREFPASSPVAGWGVVQPCIAPAGEARHTGEVLLDLARRLGGDMPAALPWKNFEQVLQHRARGLFESRSGTLCVEPFDQGLVREMEARGWWMPEAASFEEFWGKLLAAGAWSDPSYNVRSLSDYTGNADGKFDLVSRELQDRLAGSGAKAVEWMPHFHSEIDGSPNLTYPLLLNPYRPGKLGAWAHALLPWVIQAAEPPEGSPHSAAVELNAADAKASGIRNLDWVWIESAVGKIKARALVSPATAPGVVGMPYTPGNAGGGNWLRSPRANPLDLIAPERDPVTGEAYRFNTRVKVYKA